MTATRGIVINVHGHGATVRLDDGTLASVPAAELAAHRPAYIASLQSRTARELAVERTGRRAAAFLGGTARAAAPAPAPAPAVTERAGEGDVVRVLRPEAGDADPLFEHRIAAYLKSTEEWAPPDRPAPDERHLIRKKKRAAFFEGRTKKPAG